MDFPSASHPADQILNDFGLGLLDERASDAIVRHLESCPRCRRRVADLAPDTFVDRSRAAQTCVAPSSSVGPAATESFPVEAGPAPRGPLPEGLDYEFLKCLGGGGQGSAFLVRDLRLGRLVVLKRYHAGGAVVEQEGQALARVRSRFTAQCHGLERRGDELFLVMEYIPGNSLAEVRKRRALGLDELVRMVEQVAEGLEAVHACGLVHRDIKPSNIVVGDDGEARLVDFGLATHLGSAALREISGSPAYMSPEQARGQWERIDARADVYGLGAVLYNLLTGESPRDGRTPFEILEKARDEPIVPPRRKNPRAPRGLERICLKAMAADPNSRYPSAQAMRHALRRYRLIRRAVPVVGASVALLTLIVAAWMFLPQAIRPSGDARGGAIADRKDTGPKFEPKLVARSDLRVTRFQIAHFARSRTEELDKQRSGVLGKTSFVARVKDQLTVRAELSESAYSYLIALRPDGTDELCDPEDEGLPPPENRQPMYPPPARSDLRYELSEGAGLYAFALVVSREPLPPYRDWKRLHAPLAWSAGLPYQPGVVYRDFGDGVEPLMAIDPGRTRGKGAEAAGPVGAVLKLANWLRGLPGVDLVAVEAFPAEPAAGP